MNIEKIAQASLTLKAHRTAGTKLKALPVEQRPHDRDEGYAIQAEILTQSAHPLFGWKIAATSLAGQQHINVGGPMAGRILAETVIKDGGTTSLEGNKMLVAEPEFAFRMRIDLAPRATAYTVVEVLDAVDTLHPAIELPDSRFANFVGAGAPQIIADNACAHEFVLGPAATCNWRTIDLAEERPVITRRGERFVGHGRNVLGDPCLALAWLVNELSGLSITLHAGEIVTTGTCHVPLPIQPGDIVTADFAAIGCVSVSFR